jgi:hypothetical protein
MVSGRAGGLCRPGEGAVATARLHAVARALLHAPEDPLREAEEVLSRPGPLTEFDPAGFILNGP